MSKIDISGFIPDDEDDARFERAKREFADKARNLEGFPGIAQARALFRLMCDSEQPWHRRALAAAGILYLCVPLDCLPDVLPGGLLDDLAVLVAIVLVLSGIVDRYLDDVVRHDEATPPV